MKSVSLREYFPMLRTRDELMNEISSHPELQKIFYSWESEYQEEFLDFCTGVRGIKFLYDAFAKEVFNPETTPERLDEFLSLLLGQKVRVIQALPNDNTRIADESSLLVTDIVVRLEDGSLANLEIQKTGYLFPGQRSACYGADLLLRQYKAVRSRKRKAFSYKDVGKVYCIVLYEKSPGEFHKFPEDYIHRFCMRSDTGLEMELLTNYIYVPLDIFLKMKENRGIRNRLEAWLTLLGSDDPRDVIDVITQYPDFQDMYEQAYEMCRNMENIMGFFSEELRMLDRNTTQYMMDEMQAELDNRKKELDDTQKELKNKQEELSSKQKELNSKQKELGTTQKELGDVQEKLTAAEKKIAELEMLLANKMKSC